MISSALPELHSSFQIHKNRNRQKKKKRQRSKFLQEEATYLEKLFSTTLYFLKANCIEYITNFFYAKSICLFINTTWSWIQITCIHLGSYPKDYWCSFFKSPCSKVINLKVTVPWHLLEKSKFCRFP